MIAIIISSASLVISVLAYFKARRRSKSNLKYIYTRKGIIFYDEDGKEIVLKSEKL